MIKEEIIEQLNLIIGLIKQDGKDWLDDRDIPILEECVKALSQEPYTDNVSEKEQKPCKYCDEDGFCLTQNLCISQRTICNKYYAEQESCDKCAMKNSNSDYCENCTVIEYHGEKVSVPTKFVEKESCDDAISRNDMLDAVGHGTTYTSLEVQKIIKGLPSVNPVPCDDAVSREAVLKEFEKGTENLYGRIDKLPSVTPQPCEDAVSREAVKEVAQELVYTTSDKADYISNLFEELNKLPLVQPKIQTGKWLSDLEIFGHGKDDYHCSVCGRGIHLNRPAEYLTDYPFCHCGAKMESEDKE